MIATIAVEKYIIKLVRPTAEYENQVMSCRTEMLAGGDGFDGCAGLKNVESYSEWLKFEECLKNYTAKAAYPRRYTWRFVKTTAGWSV